VGILEDTAPAECLIPSQTASIKMLGGYKIDTHKYQKGQEPTACIDIPPNGCPAHIFLDNLLINENAVGIIELDLKTYHLNSGEHTISVGHIRQYNFSVVMKSFEEVMQPSYASYQITSTGIQYNRNSNHHSGFTINGAEVIGKDGTPTDALPNRYHNFIILGENPGEIYNIKAPSTAISHPDREFLAAIPFVPQWIIWFGKKNRSYLHLVGKAKINTSRSNTSDLAEWTTWTQKKYDNVARKALTEQTLKLWEAYRNLNG